MITEDKEFLLKIEKFDSDNSKEIILNGSATNAQMLFNQIIKGSERTINIISEKLEFYDTHKIVDSIKVALDRNVKVKILLDGQDENELKENTFFKICHEHQNCTIKKTVQKIHAHIITRDSMAYRYCVKTDDNSAIASFNGSLIAENADKKVFLDVTYNNFDNCE